MTTRIKLRRDTAANWTLNDPILAAGEPGLETDTGKTKYGDGTTAWTSLSYATGGITAREQVGYFTAVASDLPNNNYNQWFESVVADPDGNAYYVGSESNTWWTRVVKVDTEGAVVWQKEITWADGNEGQAASAVYNTATDQLVIVAEVQKSNVEPGQQDEGFAIFTVNAATGALVGDPTMVRDDIISDGSDYGWMSPSDIMLTASGDPVVSGRKGGNATIFSVTTATGSTLDTMFVDSAQFLNLYPQNYSDWYITGTNISSRLDITGVNYYDNQPATPLTAGTGTGATFDIINNGNGTYSAGVVSGGANYSVGNKIKILGTALTGQENTTTYTVGVDYPVSSVRRGTDSIVVKSTQTAITALLSTGTVLTNIDNLGETLTITGSGVEIDGDLAYPTTGTVTVSPGTDIGQFTLGAGIYGTGATPDNDITITVNAVDAGAITSVSNNGTAAGTSVATATAQSGTNIVSGSNATFNAHWRMKGNDVWYPDYPQYFGVWTNQSGSGFAIGDTLSLPAASYGGVTTGTVTVVAVNGEGAIAEWAFTGTFNTSTIKLATNNSFDFGTTGTWTVENYSSEAFVWTPDWCINFGGGDTDEAHALARDSQGNIYAAGRSYDNSTGGDDRGFLVKISSTGTLVWTNNFDSVGWSSHNDGYTGVAVDSNDDVIVVQDEQITKVSSTGTVLWQKEVEPEAPFDMWNSSLALDSDDNIYWAAEYNFMGQNTGDNFLIIKLDTDGNVVWQREAGTNYEENANWNDGHRILAVQGNRFYLSGSYDDNYNTALAISMPTDGTGASNDYRGNYFYRETTWNVSTSTSTVDVMEIGLQYTEVVTVTTNTFSLSTVTNDAVETRAVRSGLVDGRIEDLYSVSFEDGSVQTTAYTGALIRQESRIYNTNDFYPNLSHANRLMRWSAPGWNDTVQIYVPHNDDVAFPIGTQMHFVKEIGIRVFMFWTWSTFSDNNDITIMPSSPADGMQGNAFNTGEGWSVRHPNWDQVPARVTLTKTDTNTWLLECASTSHIMDWSW